MLNYQLPFRKDRGVDKQGGGVVVYVKDNIQTTRRLDLELNNLECVWLQLRINNKKILYGSFYVPPNSSRDVWTDIEVSFEMALNDNSIDYIIINGDFNENQLNLRNTKVKSLLDQFSLTQLVDEPTHFTENSSSCLDLIMTNNVNSIPYSGVGSPLLTKLDTTVLLLVSLMPPKPNKNLTKGKFGYMIVVTTMNLIRYCPILIGS